MKLLLTNVVWSNTYNESRYFDDVNVRNEWFNLPDSLEDLPIVNFNVGSDLFATCVINIGGSNLARMNYNYLVVHDNVNDEYLFYFINKATYLNGNQIQYSLELDVITTYLPTIDSLPSHVATAHVNRFKPVTSNNIVYFDTSYKSKIWLDDIPNLAKRLTYKEKIKWKYINNEQVDEWLNENIKAWLYVFISKHKYDRTPSELTQQYYNANGIDYKLEDTTIYADYNTLVIPIYKTDKRIGMKGLKYDGITSSFSTAYYYFDMDGLEAFRQLNNDDAYVYSYVVSTVPPISSLEYISSTLGFYIENDNLLFTKNLDPTFWYDDAYHNPQTNTQEGDGIPSQLFTNFVTFVDAEPYTDAKSNFIFTGSEIISKGIESYPVYASAMGYSTATLKDTFKAYLFNDFYAEPKLQKMIAKELQITSSFGSNFTLDGLKVLNNNPSLTFKLYMPITPGTNASMVRPVFNDDDDAVYQQYYNNEIIGLITNYDSTLPFASSKLQEYLANNKNFFMQRYLNMGVTFGNSLLQNVSNIPFKYGALTSSLGMAQSGLTAVGNVIETHLSIDNMRNAPSTYHDTASNILLDLSILDDFGYYIEIWDALDIDKQVYLDNINHFGYVLNIEDNLKNYFHTRKYFNYVRGEIHSISTRLSNVVKNQIKAIFNRGIRLFHVDSFDDPVTQNYELSLED